MAPTKRAVVKEIARMAEDSRSRLLRYLGDAHAAEEGGLASLRDLAAETNDPYVRAAVMDHLTVTQSQIDRLEARLQALGGGKSGGKSLLNTLIGKGSDLLNIFHDQDDKQTQDVIKAYALENFEVGMYLSLKAFADAVGDADTARMAEDFVHEEHTAGERFLDLVPRLAVAAADRVNDAGVSPAV
jgi:ferritin-like metal-binding protein YciE